MGDEGGKPGMAVGAAEATGTMGVAVMTGVKSLAAAAGATVAVVLAGGVQGGLYLAIVLCLPPEIPRNWIVWLNEQLAKPNAARG